MNLLGRALLAGFSVAMAAGGLFRSPRRTAQRPAPPKLLEGALVAGDGMRLPLQVWRPAGDPVAVIVALHGFGDWRQGFEVSAPLFAARGILVYAYDQRGFGETATRPQWPGAVDLSADLVDAVGAIGAQQPDLPVVVLGESLGASIALIAAGQANPPLADALLLAAPGVPAELPGRKQHDSTLRLAAIALPWLRAELGRGAQPWLLAGEARRFAHDAKIVRELTARTYEGLAEVARQASEVTRTNLPPTLVLHGALDTTVPEAAIRRLMVRLEPRASLLSYPNRHHLLLHEEDVDRVVDDCVTWLEPLLPAARQRRRARARSADASSAPSGAERALAADGASAARQVVKAAE